MKTLTVSCGLFIAALLMAASFSAADEKVHSVAKDGLKFAGKLGRGHADQVYLVNLVQGGTYVIEMTSPSPKALDPLLRLLDATGKVLASDDDSGGGQNARLIFPAPAAASYQVVATSSKGSGAGPYRLQIKRDDAREGDALERQVADLRRKGQYPEAIETARALLAFRQRVQGAAHWQTTNARWTLRTLEKVNALSVPDRAEVAEADKLSGNAVRLRQAGKHAQAAPLDQKALELRRKLLGEEHPDTALSYNNLALNLNFRGKYAEAAPLYEKALDLRRKLLGEEHPDTATSYNNLAFNLYSRAKYADAAPLYQKALDLYRKLLGEEHRFTATGYDNLAVNLNAQGKYAEATPLYQKALDLRRKLWGEEHPDTALSYNNLAANLDARGEHAEAAALFRKALYLRRRLLGEEHPVTAASYNNLAFSLNSQGKYAEAAPLYQKALYLFRKLLGEEHPYTATSYNNLAGNLKDQGKYVEAAPLYEKALDLRRKLLGEEHPDTATSYNNLAGNLNSQAKYAEAAPLFQQALDLYRKLLGEEHLVTATGYNNLAFSLYSQGNYADAAPLFQKGLDRRRKLLGEEHPYTADLRRKLLGEEHADTAAAYHYLAANLRSQGNYLKAEQLWARATQVFEIARLRSNKGGLERSSFKGGFAPVLALSACQARNDKALAAWQCLESGLARGLLEDVVSRSPRSISPEEKKQEQNLLAQLDKLDEQVLRLVTAKRKGQATDKELDRILKERMQAGQRLAELERERAAREVYSLKDIQARLPADAALLTWIDLQGLPMAKDPNGEHWACVVRQKGMPVWVKLPGSGPEKAWTKDDGELPGKVRAALAERQSGKAVELLPLLAKQRLEPLKEYLNREGEVPPVKHLLVHPVSVMASIPLETLTDRYTVSYVPSGTMFAKLREKRDKDLASGGRKSSDASLLALGDPVFQPAPPALAEATPPDHGVLIRVMPGLNAARNGLKTGDVLLRYADAKLFSVKDLGSAIQKAKLTSGFAKDGSIPVKVWREGKEFSLGVGPGPLGVQITQQPAAEAIFAQRDADRVIRASRGQTLQRLPRTGSEVKAIGNFFPNRLVLLDSQASEQRLDQLAAADELKQFRYLHLATHGAMDRSRGLESAIFLADDKLPDPIEQMLANKHPYDGRLTAQEVVDRWKLNADLVTLSACETGLGKESGTEGFVGFSQALFLAGAKSVVLSLWRVDDEATSLLMVRFYENLLGKRDLKAPLTKVEALKEAKSWLRNLSKEEVKKASLRLPPQERIGQAAGTVVRRAEGPRPFAHPYYWAAFILIGDPE